VGDFWTNNRDEIIVGLIMLLAGVLLAKPLEALFKRIGTWLESSFQSLGVGFQKRYYEALNSEHHRLEIIGTYSKGVQPPRLKEIFVSLRMHASVGGESKEDAPPVSWERIFDSPERRVVILGQPGAGKTTLLHYLVLVFTGHVSHPLRTRLKLPLPMYARLRDLSLPDAPKTLLGLLEWPRTLKLERVPTGYFNRRLRNGNCVVLLDGLDEVLDRGEQERVVSLIETFVNEYARYGNWFIVTCRSAGWENQLSDFRTYTVREFDPDDVRRFIGVWYREVLRSEKMANQERLTPEIEARLEREAYEQALLEADGLWQALRKKETLFHIARTPLILSLITLVYKRSTDLPEGRAELYKACLDVLLEKWDKEVHRLSIPNSPSPKGKMLVLQEIAFHFLSHGWLQMERGELENLVTPLLPKLQDEKIRITAGDLIDQIHERSGVLTEKRIGVFEFAHRALHDYLAAAYIAENGMENLLLEHAAEEAWREVILIAVGLVKPEKAAELIGALLEASGENPASLAVAGWSLGEDIQVDKKALRSQAAEKLCQALARTEDVSDFRLLTDALQTASPESLRTWLQEVLAGRDATLRRRALGFLPQLGAEEGRRFVPMLTQFIGDAHLEIQARSLAAIALAQIQAEPDAAVWQALTKARQQEEERLKAVATWAWCELGRFEELGLVKVPAGEFLMGSSEEDEQTYDDEKPQHTLYLSTYYIAKYPVTVDEYRAFVQETGYKTTDTLSLKGVGNHPVVHVNWHDALAFARWKGMTLPSEAEWEKAARGTDGCIYPWGNDWRPAHANTGEYWNAPRGWWARLPRWSVESDTTPVGQFSPRGDSPYGCADMAGNVWEWCHSLYRPYPYKADDGREDETASGDRVVRGGSFYFRRRGARCAFRRRLDPDYLLGRDRGFRVVVSPI